MSEILCSGKYMTFGGESDIKVTLYIASYIYSYYELMSMIETWNN